MSWAKSGKNHNRPKNRVTKPKCLCFGRSLTSGKEKNYLKLRKSVTCHFLAIGVEFRADQLEAGRRHVLTTLGWLIDIAFGEDCCDVLPAKEDMTWIR